MSYRIESALFQFGLSIVVTAPLLIFMHAQWWHYGIMLVSSTLTAMWFLRKNA